MGTPQIISPVIANFVLDGLEKVVKKSIESYTKSGEQTVRIKDSNGITKQRRVSTRIKVVRFADDFVIFGRSRRMLELVKDGVNKFLAERGV
jgi:RNA-directed DNA polymerase